MKLRITIKWLISKPVLQPARHSKLEKADILEMAVKHLQNVQRQQLALAMASDPSVLRKFKAGFNECAEEVKRYVGNLEGLDTGVQQRISSHLSKCINGIEQIVHLNFPGFGGIPFLTTTSNIFSSKSNESAETSGDQNNNPSVQIPHSVQLIPSRLPTGELALLLPNSNNLPYFSSVTSTSQLNQNTQTPFQDNKRSSAFVAVVPSSLNCPTNESSPSKSQPKLLSPPQSPTSSSSSMRYDQEPEALIQNVRKTPSPHGFRPVYPSQHSRIQLSTLYNQSTSNLLPEPLSIVTSTSATETDTTSKKPVIQTEVKSIRFPIQKMVEPLSIITNQSERFKQAQVLEDTANYEENIQRGVKRKYDYAQSGLLTIASPSNKIMKMSHESGVVDYRTVKSETNKVAETSFPLILTSKNIELASVMGKTENPTVSALYQRDYQYPSSSRDADKQPAESNTDMWRPW